MDDRASALTSAKEIGDSEGRDGKLSHWYQSLAPLRVDIVGDFAAKELFAIHGDSLLLHCVTNAKVDFAGTPSGDVDAAFAGESLVDVS